MPAASSPGGTSLDPGTAPSAGSPIGSGYLATPSGGVIFLQLASTSPLTGTAEAAYVQGSPPDEEVKSSSVSVSGTLTGSSIALSFDGSTLQFGTVSGNSFTVNFPQTDGSLAPVTFTRSATTAYNSALAELQAAVSSVNGQAAAAQTQAAEQKKIDDDAQAVAGSVASVVDDGSQTIQGAQQIASEVDGTGGDLAATQKLAAQVVGETGQDGTGPGSSTCGDAQSTAGDAQSVAGDAQGVEGGGQSVIGEIGRLNQAVSDLEGAYAAYQQDQQELPSYVPADPPTQAQVSQAITSARTAISQALATANGFITQANNDVTSAFAAAAQAFQAAGCGEPPQAPAPLPSISDPNS